MSIPSANVVIFLNGKCWLFETIYYHHSVIILIITTGVNVVSICPGHCRTGNTIDDEFWQMPAKCQKNRKTGYDDIR